MTQSLLMDGVQFLEHSHEKSISTKQCVFFFHPLLLPIEFGLRWFNWYHKWKKLQNKLKTKMNFIRCMNTFIVINEKEVEWKEKKKLQIIVAMATQSIKQPFVPVKTMQCMWCDSLQQRRCFPRLRWLSSNFHVG